MAWLKERAHPKPEQLAALREQLTGLAGPLALGTTQFIGGFLLEFLLGSIVLVVSLFYFLADGPKMIEAATRLSPLDTRNFTQLLVEFSKISRAVVVAMLLAALVQGILAGIGFYFAGLDSVVLLSALTMVFSLIPFVGSGGIWVTCCLWLALVDGNTGAAIGLFIYCALIVATSDNVIKPLVLHGQSNLHPLLALLSVLGGVKALGPIGIFVGPMVVAFLHAGLVMLRSEMRSLDAEGKLPDALQG